LAATAIPSWGLYRLLKGMESRKVTGLLHLDTARGRVTLGIRKGRLVQVETEVPELGFGAFLVKARMVHDPASAERLASTRRLVDAGVLRPEDAAKLHGSYARSLLARILDAPVHHWSFEAREALEGVVSDMPVDPFPELLRALSQVPNPDPLRQAVRRLVQAGGLSLAPGSEFLLSHVRAHFGATPLVALRGRSGRRPWRTPTRSGSCSRWWSPGISSPPGRASRGRRGPHPRSPRPRRRRPWKWPG